MRITHLFLEGALLLEACAFSPRPGVTFDIVGQLGGLSQAMSLEEGYVFMGAGPRLLVVDVSEPRNPRLLAQTEILPGVVEAVRAEDELAYVGAGTTLMIIDVSDPAQPVVVGRFDQLPYPVQSLTVRDNLVFVGAGVCGDKGCKAGIWIIDVSDSSEPIALGSEEFSGDAIGIALADKHIYLANGDPSNLVGGLRVVDVSDPVLPRTVGFVNTGSAQSVSIKGSFAYLAAYDGLRVIDISDPMEPVQVALLLGPTYGDLAVSSAYVYGWTRYCDVGICLESVNVIDIANPANPQLLWDFADYADGTEVKPGRKIAVVNGLAYVAFNTGLRVLDLTPPEVLGQIGALNTIGWIEYIASGDEAIFVIGQDQMLHILDVSHKEAPVEVGALLPAKICETCRSRAQAVVAAGEYAYLAMWEDGFRVVSIADIRHPNEVSFLEINGAVMSVKADGNYAYVADEYTGLRVIDISQPQRLQEIGLFGLEEGVRELALIEGYAYATNPQGLFIVDLKEPSAPRQVGFVEIRPEPQDVAAVGDYAYVVSAQFDNGTWSGSLIIVDVRDKTHPQVVGSLNLPGGGFGLAVVDASAYVAAGNEGVVVVDIGEPSSPRQIGHFDTPGQARAVVVANGYIYVADGDEGLVILRISERG